MEKFIKEIEAGDIHIRDSHQFELKSEFYPPQDQSTNTYTQEFYFFIPNSLHINPKTYESNSFYSDSTNFIRFKTPFLTYEELVGENERSPLKRLTLFLENEDLLALEKRIRYEWKLFANIFRSWLRGEASSAVQLLKKAAPNKQVQEDLEHVIEMLDNLRNQNLKLLKKYQTRLDPQSVLAAHLCYIDEFISYAITFYLTGLLDELRKHKEYNLDASDELLCKTILQEKKYRKANYNEQNELTEDPAESEKILYTRGLLNKFVVDPLLLKVNQFSLEDRYKNLIGSIAAGIAMLFYVIFFAMQSDTILINSVQFILLTTILYILKDRIKEALRGIGTKKMFLWLSDKKTDILSSDGEEKLGRLSETFQFFDEKEMPKDVVKARNRDFHNMLETFKRPETVMMYKKTLKINSKEITPTSRRIAYNIIFRYNIHAFLLKCGDSKQPFTTLDETSKGMIRSRLPKVYHLNLIMKNTFPSKKGQLKTEWKKFRLVLDKNGIKRVEQI